MPIPEYFNCGVIKFNFEGRFSLSAEILGITVVNSVDLEGMLQSIEAKLQSLGLNNWISFDLIRQAIFIRNMIDHPLPYPDSDNPTCFVPIRFILKAVLEASVKNDFSSVKQDAKTLFTASKISKTPAQKFHSFVLDDDDSWRWVREFLNGAVLELEKIAVFKSIKDVV